MVSPALVGSTPASQRACLPLGWNQARSKPHKGGGGGRHCFGSTDTSCLWGPHMELLWPVGLRGSASGRGWHANLGSQQVPPLTFNSPHGAAPGRVLLTSPRAGVPPSGHSDPCPYYGSALVIGCEVWLLLLHMLLPQIFNSSEDFHFHTRDLPIRLYSASRTSV